MEMSITQVRKTWCIVKMPHEEIRVVTAMAITVQKCLNILPRHWPSL